MAANKKTHIALEDCKTVEDFQRWIAEEDQREQYRENQWHAFLNGTLDGDGEPVEFYPPGKRASDYDDLEEEYTLPQVMDI